MTQTVLDTWDPENPSRPKNHGYAGSEDAIRLQFEEYILSLLSSTAYQLHHAANPPDPTKQDEHGYPDPLEAANDFNMEYLTMWRQTNNFALFDRLTSGSRIFDITEPRHPTAGGLNIEDVQRRLQQSVADLHLDERMQNLNRTIATGREKVGAGIHKIWADYQTMREQRAQPQPRTREDTAMRGSTESSRPTQSTEAADKPASPTTATSVGGGWASTLRERASKIQVQRPDTTQVQAAAKENAAKAGAYLSSWGSWAKERGKEWQEGRKGTAPGEETQSDNSTLSVAQEREKKGPS